MKSQHRNGGQEVAPGAPSVSVIVPAYNCQEYIEHSVQSILAQGWERLEIIIVNDRSADDTWAKIEEMAGIHAQVVPCQNQRSKGPSGARNSGLDRATGDYIAFLDADDVWLPNHLEQGLGFLEKMPDVGVIFFNFDLVEFTTQENLGDWFSRGTQLRKLKTRDAPDGFRIIEDDLLSAFLQESFLHLQSMIVRRDFCRELRFDENTMYGEDCDFAIKLAVEAGANFAFKDSVTGIYYRHDNSLTTNRDDSLSREGLQSSLDRTSGIVEMLTEYFVKYDLTEKQFSLLSESLYRRHITKTYLYRKLGRLGEAGRSLRTSWRYGRGRSQAVEMIKLIIARLIGVFRSKEESLSTVD